MTFALRIWCIGACLALSESLKKNDLSCYQCNVSEGSACTLQYLLPCPDDQLYDRCQTRDRKTGDGHQWVEKGCALAPCHLPREEEAHLGLLCDYSASAYDCVFCCRESGCNGSGASSLVLPVVLLLLPLLAPLLTPSLLLLAPTATSGNQS
ncbi:uncharacterized protein [Panulirus ornatus]|uniref:uncharacterized protein n=1 Tax=Panulirus ornatus TaxID=150431 RepID=UPI003A85C985